MTQINSPRKDQEEFATEPPQNNWVWFVQSELVDVFGKLLPGTVFIALSTAALIWPFNVLFRSDPNIPLHRVVLDKAGAIAQLSEAMWIPFLIFLLFFAYMIGQLLYRQDIKKPDRESFNRSVKREGLTGKEEQEIRKELACGNDKECEFPYPYLYDYFEKRGLKHLLNFITWKDYVDYRTKNYINILKVLIKFYRREQAIEIARNEGNVRLMSSTWHGARIIIWIALFGFAVTVLGIIKDGGFPDSLQAAISVYGPAIAVDIVILSIALLLQLGVITFFHIVRMRELVHIFETTCLMARENYNFNSIVGEYLEISPVLVAKIQEYLDLLGFKPGQSDGSMVAGTTDAIKQYLSDKTVVLKRDKEALDVIDRLRAEVQKKLQKVNELESE